MKDTTKETLETSKTSHLNAVGVVDFCLGQIYKNKTKLMSDEIVYNLTFEELIGALLAAKRELMRQQWDDEEE